MRNVFEIHNDTKAFLGVASQAIAADGTTVGAIIDTKGYEALEYFFLAKTITDGDYAVDLYEGDESDLSDETIVSAEEMLGDISIDTTASVARVGYIGKKRYVRAKVVATNVTTGIDILSGIAVLANAAHKPVAAQNG